MRKRMTAALLSLALALSPLLSGCGGPPRLQARDLMAEVPAPKVPVDTQMTEDSAAAVMDFCVRLFQEGGVEGENVLISPVSVLYALAMAANGAQGDTLEQMEAVLGLPLLELNEFCRAWLAALPEEDGALSIANSLWFRDSEMLTVEESFLEANALWYGADVYEAPFDDATVSDVNAWVDYHTGGMIPAILEEIPENAMVYLVNALAFDGRWETPYREDQVRAGTFTREDGTVREAELMYSTEDWYLSDGKAQGFLKYYEGCDYAFAALLPPEGVPLADYIASLDGQKLARVLDGAGREEVQAAIPKFEMAYSAELSRALQDMSMTDAFAPSAADFSAMGRSERGPLFITQVLHRTFLSVDEEGTRAAAATAVVTGDSGEPVEPKKVYLDRPFLCLLLDCGTGLPLFLGAVTDVG